MGIFTTVPVKKPRMSAFDLSYNNFFTCDMGELIPAFKMHIVPSDRVQYSPTFQVRFAPMLNPVFGDIYAKMECFFIPYRLVWSNWKNYITGFVQDDGVSSVGAVPAVPTSVPFVGLTSGLISGGVKPSALLESARLVDFFGGVGFYRYVDELVKGGDTWPAGSDAFKFSCFPFRAYTLVWNEYYRDEFVDPICALGARKISESVYKSFFVGDNSLPLDYYGIFRRRWSKDYFTTATPNPQFGATGAGVNVSVGGSDINSLSAFFTVAQFRVANALQRFLERTNIGGGRYNEFILAHFGCMPTDATIQRPEFLGSVTAPVQVSAVANTAGGTASGSTIENATGSFAGVASAIGTSLCFRRSFKEYGIILGLFSVFPRPIYSDGVQRYLTYGVKGGTAKSTDTPDKFMFGMPEFAGIGDQQIDKSELMTGAYASFGQGFGYQQRYAEFKFNHDEVHGDFALSDKLPQYTFARFFGSDTIALNSSFLECNPRKDPFVVLSAPKGTETATTVQTCWVQLRNNVKAIRPFPKFSTPTL